MNTPASYDPTDTIISFLFVFVIIYFTTKTLKSAKLIPAPDPNLSDPKGIGGWLVFLIVSLVLLRPVLDSLLTGAMLANFHTDPSQSQDAMGPIGLYLPWLMKAPELLVRTLIWLWVAGKIALSIYAADLLSRRRTKKAVKTVIFIIWLTGPVYPLIESGLLGALSGALASPEIRDAIWGVTKIHLPLPFLGAAIWTLYLLLSRRVKRTYILGLSTSSSSTPKQGMASPAAEDAPLHATQHKMTSVISKQTVGAKASLMPIVERSRVFEHFPLLVSVIVHSLIFLALFYFT